MWINENMFRFKCAFFFIIIEIILYRTILFYISSNRHLFCLSYFPWYRSGIGRRRVLWEIPHNFIFIFLDLHQSCLPCSSSFHGWLGLPDSSGGEPETSKYWFKYHYIYMDCSIYKCRRRYISLFLCLLQWPSIES